MRPPKKMIYTSGISMRALSSHHLLSVLLAVLAYANASEAACRLPIPDGGDERPSTPNLHGRITAVSGSDVFIRHAKTGRSVRVRLPEAPEIYSAFGGDVPLSDLASGQTVWVWFTDCKWPKKSQPSSAYFQIYSKDPNDRP
jgi:hypothetical protein